MAFGTVHDANDKAGKRIKQDKSKMTKKSKSKSKSKHQSNSEEKSQSTRSTRSTRSIRSIEDEMYIQLRLDVHSPWVPCQVIDMSEPIETKSSTRYPILVLPLTPGLEREMRMVVDEDEDEEMNINMNIHDRSSSMSSSVNMTDNIEMVMDVDDDNDHNKDEKSSISTKPLFIAANNSDFLSPEQESILLSSSFSSFSSSSSQPLLQVMLVDSKVTRLSPEVRKYYRYRYHLFSRWGQGIQFDEVGLFSVTPESLALHTAIRCSCDVVIDAFAGIGGNAIQLARTCNHVIAIELDAKRLGYLKHNSEVYGVQKKIDCICGDSLRLLPQYVLNE